MARPKRTAFTLVELMVVITIIVVLISLLAPSLDIAIEAAIRVKCAANLHAWGVAINQYAIDHRRRVLSTIRLLSSQGSVYPYASCAWETANYREGDQSDDRAGATKPLDFSIEAVQSYIGGVQPYRTAEGLEVGKALRGPWVCPANGVNDRKDRANAQAMSINGWFGMDYSYYARADIWGSACASRPDDLTGKDLLSGKLLMADTMYWYGPDNAVADGWWWNHSDLGPSAPDPSWGPVVHKGTPSVTGGNQLFGDGSVAWKDKTPQDCKDMYNLRRWMGWVNTQPTMGKGPNVSFY
jgi:prepilin-type N-terminal cleavage/methylation domain-containing protein